MLASLRNGLVDSLSVTGRHRASAAVRHHLRHNHISVRATDGLSWRVSRAIALQQCRHVSTESPSTPESKEKDLLHPVPNAAPRKHKVELRPGPVKPPKTVFDRSSNPKEVDVASSRTAQDSTTPTSLPHDVSTTSSGASHPSVIGTALEDYSDASKHGILTPPPEGASWPKKLFHQAKELFKFYWNGVKLINTHRLRVRAIQARVKAGGSPLSRWESRFIANYKEDALKLIPFVLIILIAEEAIPLVVIYAPFLLPSTCLLPSQKERIDNKRREKQKSFAESMKNVFENVHSRALTQPDLSASALLDRTAVLSYNGAFSLSTFGIPQIRLRRLMKHLKFISADDALLTRENWGERLSSAELRQALEERGIVTEGLSTEAMRSRLRWWLAETGQSNDPTRQRLLLVAANAIGKHAA